MGWPEAVVIIVALLVLGSVVGKWQQIRLRRVDLELEKSRPLRGLFGETRSGEEPPSGGHNA